jgi:tight adherence protein B
VSTALLCLAGALALWPGTAGRSGRGRLRRASDRRASRSVGAAVLAAPVPAGVVALLGGALLSTPLVALLAAGCAVLGARAWSGRRRARRDRGALAALTEALGALGAELRAGRPVEQAARSAAQGCGDTATGTALVRAVSGAGELGDAPTGLAFALDRLAAAARLSARTGCSLADVVCAVEDDLRGRLRLDDELWAATAAPRAGALLLAGLPVLGLAMGAGVGADPWGILTTTGVGQVLLVAGVGLEVAGVVWSGRLVRRAVR